MTLDHGAASVTTPDKLHVSLTPYFNIQTSRKVITPRKLRPKSWPKVKIDAATPLYHWEREQRDSIRVLEVPGAYGALLGNHATSKRVSGSMSVIQGPVGWIAMDAT